MHSTMIKIVVDIRHGILAGGGEMHADCEDILLNAGNLWGANWYPTEQRIEFESLINIRARLGNRSIVIQSETTRQQVEEITRKILGGMR